MFRKSSRIFTAVVLCQINFAVLVPRSSASIFGLANALAATFYVAKLSMMYYLGFNHTGRKSSVIQMPQ